MEREAVLYLIKYYKEIDKNVKFNNGIIKDYEDSYYNVTVTPSYTDGIHGKGDISAPVEDMVMTIPEEVREHMEELKRSNRSLMSEKTEFWTVLNYLDYTQKMLLYHFYINRYSWERIARELNYSTSHCRTMRDKALDRFGELLEGKEKMIKIIEKRK